MKLQLNFRGRKSKSYLASGTMIRVWRTAEKREFKVFLPTCKAAEFASLVCCQHSHQRRAAETGIKGTLSAQKLPCVPLWFPSCPSANHVTPICLSFSCFNRLSGNKLAKAVKYVKDARQASGGREGDYFQTYFTVYAK